MTPQALGDTGAPSRRDPPPRTASKRVPVAWLATTAASGPSRSTAQRLVAHQGKPRQALVDPSTGPPTTTTDLSRAWQPDSSDTTPKPAPSSTDNAARSTTRPLRCWPGRVPAGLQSSSP